MLVLVPAMGRNAAVRVVADLTNIYELCSSFQRLVCIFADCACIIEEFSLAHSGSFTFQESAAVPEAASRQEKC